MIDEKKLSNLNRIITELARTDVALAFSGGVDSSLLLYMMVEAAKKNNTKVYAVTVNTELHPACDLEIAKKVIEKTGAIHIVLHMNELTNEQIVKNPVDRCYLCKKMLFNNIFDEIKKYGVTKLVEGTNEDDTHVYRPGIKAIKELGVRSPLMEAMITKEEVRTLARKYEISVSNRPSTPCLATRFPYGTIITNEKLEKVEKAENIIKGYIDGNVRVRIHENIARIETDEKYISTIFNYKNDIISELKRLGYDYVTIDLEGFRSGSMDIGVDKQ